MNDKLLIIPIILFVLLPIIISYQLTPPDPPRMTNGTIGASSVTTTWSIPDHNGGTGTISYNIKRSATGSSFTSIATQTTTTYTDNSPILQTYAYYRIYSNDTSGTGCWDFPRNTTITGNLKSHYPFCYSAHDNGNYDDTMTVTGTTSYATINSGDRVGIRLNGASYLTPTTETRFDYDYNTPHSFVILYNASSSASNSVVYDKREPCLNGGAGGEGIFINTAGTAMIYSTGATCVTNDDYSQMVASSGLTNGNLQHVVIVNDGTGNAYNHKWYLNGTLQSTSVVYNTTSSTSLNNVLPKIGARQGGPDQYLNGGIYDFMIFNTALNQNAVTQLYNNYLYAGFSWPPDPVTDLTYANLEQTSVDLIWTQPDLHDGILVNYRVNYTTPYGTPSTFLANTTNTYLNVTGLTDDTPYSFRVKPLSQFGYPAGGNILNVTTDDFLVIGNLTNPDIANTDDFQIFFERDDLNATALRLNVTYSDTYDLSCNFAYQLARTNNTYSNLANVIVDAENVESSFLLINATGDIINVRCYDEITGDESFYVITITDFPFLQQIDNLRNGTYGTAFQFGAIDGVILVVLILSMIGFNRTNPAAGVIFLVITVGVLSYFGIITYPIIMYPALALLVLWAVITTRKDD